jgi:hypothetical protein
MSRPAPHGGLCLLSDSYEDFPEDLGDFSQGFLYFINFTRRISEALMGGRWARSVPLCVIESKKTGARSARARTRGQNPLVYVDCAKLCDMKMYFNQISIVFGQKPELFFQFFIIKICQASMCLSTND